METYAQGLKSTQRFKYPTMEYLGFGYSYYFLGDVYAYEMLVPLNSCKFKRLSLRGKMEPACSLE